MRSVLTVVIPRLAWAFLHFIGKTSRIVWLNKGLRYSIENKEGNFIYAFWHGRQVFITYAYRNLPVTCMVSQSKDGEYIARVIEYFGEQTVRGSSSRGGLKALMDMKQHLDSGRTVGLTPDGPRGPQRSVAGGILHVAQESGKPIVPLAYSAKRKLIFKGWDDFWVPLPFNRLTLAVGTPVRVGPSDDLALKAEELKVTLNTTTEAADKLALQSRPLFESIAYFLYTALATLLFPLILLAVFVRYPKTFLGHFSEGAGERLAILPKKKAGDWRHPVWIHASSLGECRAALPFVKAFRESHPGEKIAFTSTTPNGVREARKLKLGDQVLYAPIDCPFTVNRFLNAVQPRLLLLLESELWPNWLARVKDQGIPAGVINGRMSGRSAKRYRAFSFLSRMVFEKIDFVAARESADKERFVACGVDPAKVKVTGNMKYDLAPWEMNGEPGELGGTGETSGQNPRLWAAGSVRDGEESLVLETHRNLLKNFPDLTLIIAPRHMERLGTILDQIKSMKLTYALRSQSVNGGLSGAILIWDTFGDLWKAYQMAGVVFVGGSLVPKGGQNPIEPAWFSKPILFGPSMTNFAEPAEMLLSQKGAIQVDDRAELESEIAALLNDPARAAELGKRSRRVIDSFRGQATKNTLKIVEPYL